METVKKEKKGFFKVSKSIAGELGNDAAILYAHLEAIDRNYFKPKSIEYFYQQQSRLAEECNILRCRIPDLLKSLEDKGYIMISRHRGAKNMYKIVRESSDPVNSFDEKAVTQGTAKTKIKGFKTEINCGTLEEVYR